MAVTDRDPPPAAPAVRSGASHPRRVLCDSEHRVPALPVCDHYAGDPVRMSKSLELQAELGPVFDVTLDCEDGAPIGGEREHAQRVAEAVMSAANRYGRVGARVHALDHPSFEEDAEILIGRAGSRLAYLMVPKPRDLAQVERACMEIDRLLAEHGLPSGAGALPVHVAIETHGALRDVDAIAAHPRIESLSFGLMDFVSAHRGAIPAIGLSAAGQFRHPLVLRAKLEIAAAAHTHYKVPSHCVVTEFSRAGVTSDAATRASRELGYLRMWSIHPKQVRAIVDAFAPSIAEVDQAIDVLDAAEAAGWSRIRHRDAVYDLAGFRYFWQVLERARRTGQPIPAEITQRWFDTSDPLH